MKKIAILGSTGSIGESALDVIREQANELQVVALAAGKNIEKCAAQIREFKPNLVSVANAELAKDLRNLLVEDGKTDKLPEIVYGDSGLEAVATHPDAQMVLTAVVGVRGLLPTLQALQAGKDLALANKEPMVAAGHLVQEMAKRSGSKILPVDSEHSAIFQCLRGESPSEVKRLILTGSGGPFRTKSRDELAHVTVSEALKHPTWSMGAKITIDSATLMNKGLEVIEAHWLFGIPFAKIDVVLHPQSLVHSMVEFIDGAIMAQLSTPDMRLPIQLAFSYPARYETKKAGLDLVAAGTLTFEAPDLARFPALRLCFQAVATGGTAPAVINAANEVANSLFLEGKIPFLGIEQLLEIVLDQHSPIQSPSLEEVLGSDEWARKITHAAAIERFL